MNYQANSNNTTKVNTLQVLCPQTNELTTCDNLCSFRAGDLCLAIEPAKPISDLANTNLIIAHLAHRVTELEKAVMGDD